MYNQKRNRRTNHRKDITRLKGDHAQRKEKGTVETEGERYYIMKPTITNFELVKLDSQNLHNYL